MRLEVGALSFPMAANSATSAAEASVQCASLVRTGGGCGTILLTRCLQRQECRLAQLPPGHTKLMHKTGTEGAYGGTGRPRRGA